MMQQRNDGVGDGLAGGMRPLSARSVGAGGMRPLSARSVGAGGMRPLSARSVVASTLLGMDPPRLPARLLVRTGALFGIAEGTTRTAVSRMLAAGELVSDGDGAEYALAGHLLERRDRQVESRRGALADWDGTWVQAVVVAGARSAGERSALRRALGVLHFAELREGVWLRPDNLDPARQPGASAIVTAQCQWFRLAPLDDARAMVGALWDLQTWAGRAWELLAEMDTTVGALERRVDEAIAPAFVLSAAVLRHLLADPRLPDELRPAGWPGDRLRAAYDTYDETFKAAWRDWFRRQLD